MPLLPRPEIKNLPPVTHGGLLYYDLDNSERSFDRILDFSVCCNPYLPNPSMSKSLRSLKFNTYPDSHSTELRSSLSQKLGVSKENLLAGNGSTELIRLIALAYFNKADRVIIPCPTYGEYEIASLITGAEVIKYPLEWQKTETQVIKGLTEAVRKYHPNAVFLCNPNNPTGQYYSQEDVGKLISSLGDALLILDEAYFNFVDEAWASCSLINSGHLIILRSMTKDYGLAGLRLGYIIADSGIINALRQICPPWNVNSLAQQAGIAALGNEDYLTESQKKIQEAKIFLVTELTRMGFTLLPSKANFFLMKVKSGRIFQKALMKQGMLVRDCDSFGLPEYVRIAPRTIVDCRRLIRVVKSLLQRGELDAGF